MRDMTNAYTATSVMEFLRAVYEDLGHHIPFFASHAASVAGISEPQATAYLIEAQRAARAVQITPSSWKLFLWAI